MSYDGVKARMKARGVGGLIGTLNRRLHRHHSTVRKNENGAARAPHTKGLSYRKATARNTNGLWRAERKANRKSQLR